MTHDKRRRHWVPLSVDFASSPTGTKILTKFGHAGLITWVAFLAACKKNRIEGQFTFSSEPEGWMKLGLDYPATPDFDLESFFTFTGRLKKTRKTRIGRTQHIVCTTWEDWRVRSEKPQKSSKRTQNTDTMPQDADAIEAPNPYPYSPSPKDTITVTPTLRSLDEKGESVEALLAGIQHKDEETEKITRYYAGRLPIGAFRTALDELNKRRDQQPPLINEGKYVNSVLRNWVQEGRYGQAASG